MKYVVCLPFVHRPYFDECMATCKMDPVIAVDNTMINIGIMRAHNRGIDYMQRMDADWLVILSAAIRFGPPGGLDFIAALEAHPDHLVLEATPVFGWHLIAFSRRCIEKVGRWDENFSPYGFDDLDYSWRIQQAFSLTGMLWDKVPVDLTDMGMAHGIKLAGVHAHAEPLIEYYQRKWGVRPGTSHERAYKTPFNRKDVGVYYWPTPNHAYSRRMA